MCCDGGLSSALYASFLDSPVFSSAGSTVKFARECNNPIFLTADLTHFFPFMKQHMHGGTWRAAGNLMPGSPVETGTADTPLRRDFPAFFLLE